MYGGGFNRSHPFDSDGKVVVKYTYDSWGNVVEISGTGKDDLGVKNPFRYRGYYYDTETGMYYLKSRYYDPELRRFICADGIGVIAATPMALTNKNLYLYCDENPLIRKDTNGQLWFISLSCIVIGATVNVATTFIATKVTGQEYGWGDAVLAEVSGAAAGVHPIVGGVASSMIAGIVAGYKGAGMGDIISNAAAAALGTMAVGSLSGYIKPDVEKLVNISFSVVFGTDGNLVSSAVNAGINQKYPSNSTTDRGSFVHAKPADGGIQRKCPQNNSLVGYTSRYNGNAGNNVTFAVYRSDTDSVFRVLM